MSAYTAIVKSGVRAWNGIARRVGLSRSAPLGFGVSLKRTPFRRKTPIKSGPVNFARGNLQRNETPRVARKRLKRQSVERAALQATWNAFTAAKLADNGCCQRCGAVDKPEHKLHGHHVCPLGRGGAWSLDNHCLLCPECHGWVHDFPAAAEAVGLLISGRKPVTPITTRAIGETGGAA